MAASAIVEKRALRSGTLQTFSCGTCYKRKQKCDRATPCSYCRKNDVVCSPSLVATTARPRKQRFPEAELLARIKKYEAALLSYGADLESIRQSAKGKAPCGSGFTLSANSSHAKQAADDYATSTSSLPQHEEVHHRVLTILDGEGQDDSSGTAGQKWYDRIFAHESDTSSFLFASDPIELPNHPAPFDIFKLWQIYCDNVHPLNKTIHAPTFQRKISDYGAQLHLAPASDQALFFAVYVAALTSLSPEECEAMFFTNREILLSDYKLATQVWLRRAGLWRTSDLSVLQAFILYLSSIQNVVDPRSISCFTAVADRIARRIRLHRDGSRHLLDALQLEIRRRVWWELVFLDARAAERVSMGTSVLTSRWTVSLPSTRSDADLEALRNTVSDTPLRPSSEAIFMLVRAEAAQFLEYLRTQPSIPRNQASSNHKSKIQMIEDFETRLHSRILCHCDTALPHHRLTVSFASMTVARMRMSIYTVEESLCKEHFEVAAVQSNLLQQCIKNVRAYTDLREDASLTCFKWFLFQNMPILGYIHLLRLLQVHVVGSDVDEAWQVIERFRITGVRLVIDSLTLKAWNARTAASPNLCFEEPSFITEIRQRRLAATSADMLPHLRSISVHQDSTRTPSESDFMAMLDDMLSGEVINDLDWSSWLHGQ